MKSLYTSLLQLIIVIFIIINIQAFKKGKAKVDLEIKVLQSIFKFPEDVQVFIFKETLLPVMAILKVKKCFVFWFCVKRWFLVISRSHVLQTIHHWKDRKMLHHTFQHKQTCLNTTCSHSLLYSKYEKSLDKRDWFLWVYIKQKTDDEYHAFTVYASIIVFV